MGICLRYVRYKEEAEDIFQEAFIKIFKTIHTLQKTEAIGSWVKRIVINTAVNHYYANLKYHNQPDTEGVDLSDESGDILSQLTLQALLSMIQEMPEGYRLIFNLYVIDGYSHAEIAQLMHISEGTSKSQLSRAKDFLKKELGKKGIAKYERI
jgi:RNA polymerase sigma-70 factor (ECF subfamily)